jgi:hypothetical protein
MNDVMVDDVWDSVYRVTVNDGVESYVHDCMLWFIRCKNDEFMNAYYCESIYYVVDGCANWSTRGEDL